METRGSPAQPRRAGRLGGVGVGPGVPLAVLFGVALTVIACTGSTRLGVPSPTASAGEEREAAGTMRMWLRDFREAQGRHHRLLGRYADDVTVDGRIEPLPSPYRTSYDVHPRGIRYLVQVRNPSVQQLCKLEQGEGAFEPGEIICNAF